MILLLGLCTFTAGGMGSSQVRDLDTRLGTKILHVARHGQKKRTVEEDLAHTHHYVAEAVEAQRG